MWTTAALASIDFASLNCRPSTASRRCSLALSYVMPLQNIDDDCLVIILACLPAEEAQSAFCVSHQFATKAAVARENRLKLFWRALFRSDVGFPDVKLLSQTDVTRFEQRLMNFHTTSRWKCLSCLKPSIGRSFGDFCTDCVGDESAFVAGNGGYVMCDVTCGHKNLVYWCALCEASSCRSCLMAGACTFCLLLPADAPACEPCEP